MRSLQDLRGISILVQGHACLLVPTSRSLMWIVFSPLEGILKGVRVLGFGL